MGLVDGTVHIGVHKKCLLCLHWGIYDIIVLAESFQTSDALQPPTGPERSPSPRGGRRSRGWRLRSSYVGGDWQCPRRSCVSFHFVGTPHSRKWIKSHNDACTAASCADRMPPQHDSLQTVRLPDQPQSFLDAKQRLWRRFLIILCIFFFALCRRLRRRSSTIPP
eukprot:gene11529-biopygen15427